MERRGYHLPFFKEENCSVLLTFPSHNDTIFRSYKINTAKTYGNGSELVVSDFENGFNPNFTNFFNQHVLKKLKLVVLDNLIGI